MGKEKATITIDRAKAAHARDISGARSTSEVVDRALDVFIRTEQLRADVEAYRKVPPSQSEIDVALIADAEGLDDDTDWQALYADMS